MEMTAQTTMATVQAPANPTKGAAASNKSAAPTMQLNDRAAKPFTDVLSQTMNGETSSQSTEATSGLEALLQTLSPVLLMALLTQGQSDKPGVGEAGEVLLDPALVQALQALDVQSDALTQLMNSVAYQQWLSKVSDLLDSMNAGEGSADTSNGSTVSLQANELAIPKTAAQAQMIVNQFLTALSQNKDSLLFQQLVESFQEIVSPVLASQASPKVSNPTKGLYGSAPETGVKAKETVANLQATVQALQGGTSKVDTTVINNVDSSLGFKMQVHQGNKQFSQLDALSVKSGMADRIMLAALQSGFGPNENANDDLLTAPDPLGFQDLSRLLQTEQLKAVKPVTAQSFVQDMSQLVLKNFKVDAINGFSEARLTLSPENLGQVNIKLTMHNGQLVAHFAAQTLLGKEMLEGQLSQLKLSLQGQGLQVERLEVTQGSNLQSGMFQDQRHQQFSQQTARQNKHNFSNMDTLPESFSAEMANLVKLSGAYGNAFNATA